MFFEIQLLFLVSHSGMKKKRYIYFFIPPDFQGFDFLSTKFNTNCKIWLTWDEYSVYQ